MLAGLGDYGSDSDSDSETLQNPPSQTEKKLNLPPPQSKPKRPKKIAIALPALAKDDLDDEKPPPKKPRLESGAGSSSLMSMLPAPKVKHPVVQPERVLGGGKGPGLVFKTAPSSNPIPPQAIVGDDEDVAESLDTSHDTTTDTNPPSTSLPMIPTNLSKRKANISVEDTVRHKAVRTVAAPSVDFFGLGTSTTSKSSAADLPTKPSTTSKISVSSAPKVVEFKPPTPTPEDPYPGYYLLPSGAWAAHDPEYYNTFLKKWKKEYDAHVRALEKGTAKGFEGSEDSEEVNAMKEMEKARIEIQERESRKAVTKDAAGEPAKPRMNIDPAKQSGRARSRHQLSSLLTEAYTNREVLEDKIAEGRRNRKEAGNKYGF
ncbi:hypothetical protein ONZ45_g1679 [Pleurotus djamor]|nr:hypothetical protein ONZ45_g1679 [Pleurotus djamor]